MVQHCPWPNFFIVGAAKCGTTSLYAQLRRHPDVHLCRRKEPTYFSSRCAGRWQRGHAWYLRQFRGWSGERAVGEASTSYTKAPWYDDAPGKIARAAPDARILYMVRDPVDQIRSHFRHLAYYEGDRRSFEQMLRDDDFLLGVASYATQIRRYLEYFSRRQIMLIPFEAYVVSPGTWLSRVCRFLGVDSTVSLDPGVPRNQTAGRRITRPVHWPRVYERLRRTLPVPAMRLVEAAATRPLPEATVSKETASRVVRRLRSEVRALEDMFGLDLSGWQMDFARDSSA